uniref:Uncharacterized protein n=1 Tax=Davidia involucrata TaxID=16924 RepID=A0A5B6YY49_DAVIN
MEVAAWLSPLTISASSHHIDVLAVNRHFRNPQSWPSSTSKCLVGVNSLFKQYGSHFAEWEREGLLPPVSREASSKERIILSINIQKLKIGAKMTIGGAGIAAPFCLCKEEQEIL